MSRFCYFNGPVEEESDLVQVLTQRLWAGPEEQTLRGIQGAGVYQGSCMAGGPPGAPRGPTSCPLPPRARWPCWGWGRGGTWAVGAWTRACRLLGLTSVRSVAATVSRRFSRLSLRRRAGLRPEVPLPALWALLERRLLSGFWIVS